MHCVKKNVGFRAIHTGNYWEIGIYVIFAGNATCTKKQKNIMPLYENN